jgi:hypothetical protein
MIESSFKKHFRDIHYKLTVEYSAMMANSSIAAYSVISSGKFGPFLAKSSHKARHYAALRLFLSAFFLLSFLAISTNFWIRSSKKPILLPVELGIWLRAHPKYATYLWTGAGTLSSFVTLLALGQVLSIAASQSIAEHGVTISTVEGIAVRAHQFMVLLTQDMQFGRNFLPMAFY